MGILDRIVGKKNPLEKLTRNELETEKITLEREERKYLVKLKELEVAKKKEFERGVGKTLQEKNAIIREIKRLENQTAQTNRDLNRVNKQLIVVDNLTNALDMKDKLIQKGIWAKMARVSGMELENALSEMHMNEDQLAATLGRVTAAFMDELSPFAQDEMVREEEAKLLEAWKMAEKGVELDKALEGYEKVREKTEKEKETY